MDNKACLLEKTCFGQKWWGPCTARPQTEYPKLKPEADPKAVKGWKLSVTLPWEVGGAFLREYLRSLSPYLLQFLLCVIRTTSPYISGEQQLVQSSGGSLEEVSRTNFSPHLLQLALRSQPIFISLSHHPFNFSFLSTAISAYLVVNPSFLKEINMNVMMNWETILP